MAQIIPYVMIAAAGVSAYSTYQQGAAADAAAQYNAAMARNNADTQARLAEYQARNNAALTEAQARAAEANAKVLQDTAAAQEESSRREVGNVIRERDSLMSTQRARAAAMGIDVSSGSPLDVYTDTARTYQMRIAEQRYQDSTEIQQLGRRAQLSLVDAASSRLQADQYRVEGAFAGVRKKNAYTAAAFESATGRNTRRASVLSAAGTFLSGASGAYRATA